MCLSPMHRSVLLLLHRQCGYLLVGVGFLRCLQFIHLAHFLLTSQIQFMEGCVGLQCLAQCTCSFITNVVGCLLMYVGNFRNSSIFLLFFMLTSQIQWLECCVCLQCLDQCSCSFSSNVVACLFVFVVGNVCNSSIFLTFLLTFQI